MTKITLSTLKKFIKDNKNNLHIKYVSVRDIYEGNYYQAENQEFDNLEISTLEHDLKGLESKDNRKKFFRPFKKGEFEGIEIFGGYGSHYIIAKNINHHHEIKMNIENSLTTKLKKLKQQQINKL